MISETGDKIDTIQKQGAMTTAIIAKDKISDYLTDSSIEDMTEDAKNALMNIVTDMQKGATQLNDTVGLSASDIASVYKISQEEASQVKFAIIGIASASISGVVKDTLKDGLDLGVKKNNLDSPYNSNTVREDLEATYGAENVTSTTNPKNPLQSVNSRENIEVITDVNGNKAVITTYKDPLTGELTKANIPYNERGLPVFDDISKFTTVINKDIGYITQMRYATKDLNKYLDANPAEKSKFTDIQLKQIEKGVEKIDGYTWHHNGEANNMQLLPEKVHDATKHVGEAKLKEGR